MMYSLKFIHTVSKYGLGDLYLDLPFKWIKDSLNIGNWAEFTTALVFLLL